MRRLASTSALALLSLLIGCARPAPPPPPPDTVTVRGSATVPTRPDRVSFFAGVQTVDPSASVAFRRNGARVESLLQALRDRGVADDEMRTLYLDVSSLTLLGKPKAAFRVSNGVSVTRTDPTEAGDLIQTAVRAGANDVGNIRFFVGDLSAVYRKGLEVAYEDAREKAEALAVRMGRTLGKAVSVTDETPSSDGGTRFYLWSLGYVGNQIVQPGEGELQSMVSVVFTLE